MTPAIRGVATVTAPMATTAAEATSSSSDRRSGRVGYGGSLVSCATALAWLSITSLVARHSPRTDDVTPTCTPGPPGNSVTGACLQGPPGNSVTGVCDIPPQAPAQCGYLDKYWSRQGTPGIATEVIMVSYAFTHAASAAWRCHPLCPLSLSYSEYYHSHQQFMAAKKFNVA